MPAPNHCTVKLDEDSIISSSFLGLRSTARDRCSMPDHRAGAAPLALMSVRFRQPAARPPAQRMNLAHAAGLAARLELI
jgi:hypothetical protein